MINHNSSLLQGIAIITYFFYRFNWTKIPKNDGTLIAESHKFGRGTLQPNHPNQHDRKWSTVQRDTFKNPCTRTKPNFRTKCTSNLQSFDGNMREAWRSQAAFSSGFQNNAQLFDGTSWVPEKNLHTDIIRTEYRNRFNQKKPFHKACLMSNLGKMQKKSLVYDMH